MKYRQLFRVVLWIVFFAENGQIENVHGMPLVFSTGGSTSCGLGFGTLTGKQMRSRIAFEILFRDKDSFIANCSYCDLEIWKDEPGMNKDAGNKRTSHRLEVRLKIENPELYKVYVDKADQVLMPLRVNSIMEIVCSNRKFSGCIRFLGGKGTSPRQRRLLSVDQLYLYRDPNDAIPFQPIILLVAGVVILVIAGSLCTDCAKSKDDLSISEARPQLLSCHERTSQCETAPKEQAVQEAIVFESKDVVIIETAEKIEVDAVDANNHVALYDEPMVSVQHVPPQDVQHVAPKSVKHVPESKEHVPASVQHVPASVQHVQSNGKEHVTEGDHKGEKKKRGSKHDHEHEEHKGKFWRRSRPSKKSSSGSNDHRTSDGVFKDQEHKHHDRRSRKESKEQKAKSRKSKDRKSSTDSEEKKASDESHGERPREATPTLERHLPELPAPPPPPGPGYQGPQLPDRPIPQRQISAPNGTGLVEEDNYETVEVRKTKSVQNIDITVDDNNDAVRVDVGRPRLPSSVYDSIHVGDSGSRRASDLYEVVDDTSEPVDDLYDEVESAEKMKNREKEQQLRAGEIEEDEELEDPYSKIKKLKEKEALENSELYEEVDKRQERGAKLHESLVAKNGLLDVKDTESIRNRSKSDTAGLKRTENEFIKRSNTIDVVRRKEGEPTEAPLDYLYAEVDLSKKTKSGQTADGDTEATEKMWSDDNPPPLPPVYVSSKQIQIKMGRSEGTADSLYDEVGPSTAEQRRPLNMELSVSDPNMDEAKRLSGVSDDYELVEVKHSTAVVDNNYSGLVDEGPRPKAGSHDRARPAHMETRSAPADTPAVASGSIGALEEGDDGDVHYELVTPRTTSKKTSNISNLDWV